MKSRWEIRVITKLLNKGRRCCRIPRLQRLHRRQTNTANRIIILAPIAAIREIALDRFFPGLGCGLQVSNLRLKVGEDRPRFPRLGCMAKLRFTFDCPQDLLPRFVETAELSERFREIAPHYTFLEQVPTFDIPVHCLSIKDYAVLPSA